MATGFHPPSTPLGFTWAASRSTFNPETLEQALLTVPNLNLHYTPLAPCLRIPDFEPLVHLPEIPCQVAPFSLLRGIGAFTPWDLLTNPARCSDIIEMLYPGARLYGREFRHNGLLTQQVNLDDYATAVFLRHRRKDTATERWTFKERHIPPIRPGTSYLGGGSALFEAFQATYNPQYPSFNQALYELCYEEDQGALLEKGPKTLKNIAYRNCPSLDKHKAETFLKSQDITKLGTAFRDAKKGQMITGFCAAINSRFGPLSRYLYKATRSALPPEILLLNGVTLEEQEAWFARFWDWTRPCYEDDYTGFDGTQNEDFLAFQVLFMRALSVPESLISEYTEWVSHLFGLCGEMGIVIASGFKPTWFFNTIDSMAYQALKHQLTPHTPGQRVVARAFSGDDTLHNERVLVRPSYSRLKHVFRLISTGLHTTLPHFCGTVNLPSGSFADPKLLLTRVLYRLRSGRLAECALGYAEHAYRFQRRLEEHQGLPAEYLECHSLTIRILRAQLRLSGIPLIGTFLTKLLPHFFSIALPHDSPPSPDSLQG
jgi:hypothetical protein